MSDYRTNSAAPTDDNAVPEDAQTLRGYAGETIHRSDVNGHEAWVRVSTEPHLRSVEAVRNDSGGGWSVSVAAMKIVRPEHAIYRELREAIEDAMASVPGVTEIEREANDVWWASGYAAGVDLASAVAHVLDHHSDLLRHHYDNLGPDAVA